MKKLESPLLLYQLYTIYMGLVFSNSFIKIPAKELVRGLAAALIEIILRIPTG